MASFTVGFADGQGTRRACAVGWGNTLDSGLAQGSQGGLDPRFGRGREMQPPDHGQDGLLSREGPDVVQGIGNACMCAPQQDNKPLIGCDPEGLVIFERVWLATFRVEEEGPWDGLFGMSPQDGTRQADTLPEAHGGRGPVKLVHAGLEQGMDLLGHAEGTGWFARMEAVLGCHRPGMQVDMGLGKGCQERSEAACMILVAVAENDAGDAPPGKAQAFRIAEGGPARPGIK